MDYVQTNEGQMKQLPSQSCNKHGGKIIDVYCPDHDNVGCSTCITVDHRSCNGIKFIPDVAEGIKTSEELNKLEMEMKTLQSKSDALKKMKGDNLQRLRQDETDLKKEIETMRQKMNEELDKMEKELVKEIEAKFKQKMSVIQTSITELEDMLTKLNHAMDQVKRDAHDADVYVSCKLVKQEMANEIRPTHARIEKQLPELSLELFTDESIKLISEGMKTFASLKEKYIVQKADYMGDKHIRLRDDKNAYRVHAMCALPDGSIAVADSLNKKLKKLDLVSNKLSTLIDLPDRPFDLCLVDNTRLAVSLIITKEIQFVSFSETGIAKLDTSFPVGDVCRGLAYCDGLLYVCCGGSRAPVNKEGRGHVEVYNCDGELLRCVYENIDYPVYLSVVNDGYSTNMYISDHFKGVQAMGLDGVVKHRFETVLETNLPFSLIGTDQLCIAERSTGNIYVHSHDDKRLLIQSDDMVGMPISVYFDKRSSRLFVALVERDGIKVFDLCIE